MGKLYVLASVLAASLGHAPCAVVAHAGAAHASSGYDASGFSKAARLKEAPTTDFEISLPADGDCRDKRRVAALREEIRKKQWDLRDQLHTEQWRLKDLLNAKERDLHQLALAGMTAFGEPCEIRPMFVLNLEQAWTTIS